MANDYEALAKQLLSQSAGGKELDKYKSLLHTPEARRMLSQFSGAEGKALKQAAGSAAQGDADALRQLIAKVTATPEGAALVKQAMDIYQKG